MRLFAALDHRLQGLSRGSILVLAAGLGAIVGSLDWLTGYEVSMSVFYLGPVAIAAWYGGRTAGMSTALISCVVWYVADLGAGHPYTHPAIPVWNALIRLGFFMITSLLLTSLHATMRQLSHLAKMDALTGLYGRRAFEERLQHDLVAAHRRHAPITVVYIDVDNFKAINDRYGHAEGDLVLRAIGRLLNHGLRMSDTAARLGGDEFALILPDTDNHGGRRLIEGISRQFEEAFREHGSAITCSIGAVTFIAPGLSAARAIESADALMYEVKRQGKGAVAYRVLDGPGLSPVSDVAA
jgi:diguanylate cyclase (GGDEF)-like protein